MSNCSMTPRFGEVVLIRMQFHQAAGAKVRPALVLLDTGDDDFVAAPIRPQARHSDYDLVIKDWRFAGLNVPSYVRVHKRTVLAKVDIASSLAQLSESDHEALVTLLCRAYCRKT
ncbi:hypothetical protein SBA3_1860011 [Candidatus Sulfopaludibacter sp. SbA3]|nr:hypothetical protein SBA3_1860011 [Candidatus Sulfopaludibacter sp. SbA3]